MAKAQYALLYKGKKEKGSTFLVGGIADPEDLKLSLVDTLRPRAGKSQDSGFEHNA